MTQPTTFNASLTGTLELEYDESGSKSFDVVLKLPGGKTFPLPGYRVFLGWRGPNYTDPYWSVETPSSLVLITSSLHANDVLRYISEHLTSAGWEVKEEAPPEPVNYDI